MSNKQIKLPMLDEQQNNSCCANEQSFVNLKDTGEAH